jgi:hypothetical protein
MEGNSNYSIDGWKDRNRFIKGKDPLKETIYTKIISI